MGFEIRVLCLLGRWSACHLSHTCSPFFFSLFFRWGLTLLPGASPQFRVPPSTLAGIAGLNYNAKLLVEIGSH
jgi:hypothetical protein